MTVNINSLKSFSELSDTGLSSGLEALKCLMTISIDYETINSAFIEIDNLIETIQAKEDINSPSICLLQSLNGSLEGFILFCSPLEMASFIMQKLKSYTSVSPLVQEIDFQQSVMNEWANIFTGNMMASLISSAQENYIKLSVTEQIYDMKSAALDFIICQMASKADLLAVCNGKIKLKSEQPSIDIWIILNADSELLKKGDL